jgi:crossover junction endodeoxyribonuclease RusA
VGDYTETWRFDWPKAPLSLNYRPHRMAEAKIVKRLRGDMHALARHIPELGRCEVRLVWYVTTNHRRDEENIVPVLKALCDGLVDAEIVADDVPRYMKKHMPEIVKIDKRADVAHFTFTVRELPE